MNVTLHPFYQCLIHELLFNYLKLPDSDIFSNRLDKFEHYLSLKKDICYKIEGFVSQKRGVDINNKGSFTLREAKLNNIASILRQCQTWNDLQALYPYPNDAAFAEIKLQHYRLLSDNEKRIIREAVGKAFTNIPPAFKVVDKTGLGMQKPALQSIPSFNGCFLLVFYVEASRNFRVMPLKITNGMEVELRRNDTLLLQGNLQQKASNCFFWLQNNYFPEPAPILLVTTYPEANTRPLSFFSVSISTARLYRSVSRLGLGFCFRIAESDYEVFIQKDEYEETDLYALPCAINADAFYLMRRKAVEEFDHSDYNVNPNNNSISIHDAQFYGYFRRNITGNELVELPVCIKNGFVRMKHPLYDVEFTGLLQIMGGVLWLSLKTTYNSNIASENFSIQLVVNGRSLKDISGKKQFIHGLYSAIRSDDFAPICGQILLQGAVFDFNQVNGRIFTPDMHSSPELKNLNMLELML